MAEMTEVWMFVPGTGERFAVSNHGHLKQVARKRSRFGKIDVVLDGQLKRLMCSYRDSEFGWLVSYDNQSHFFGRDKLLALFKGIPLQVDTSEDAECKASRDAGYDDWLKMQSEKTAG